MSKPNKKKRFIDNDEIKEKLAELHMNQLNILLERLETGLIEPQEMRLIWDMVKTHQIGIDSVEDLVEAAQKNAAGSIDGLELDEAWGFNG